MVSHAEMVDEILIPVVPQSGLPGVALMPLHADVDHGDHGHRVTCSIKSLHKFILSQQALYLLLLALTTFQCISCLRYSCPITISQYRLFSSHHYHKLIEVNSSRSILINLCNDVVKLLLKKICINFPEYLFKCIGRDVSLLVFVVNPTINKLKMCFITRRSFSSMYVLLSSPSPNPIQP